MPPDNREVRQPGQSTNQAARQELSAREIQERLVEEIRQIGDNELELRQLANRLKDAIRDAEVAANEQRRSTELQIEGRRHEVGQGERQRTKADVVRALKAVELGIIEAPSESSKELLLKLNSRLGTGVTDTNAAYLQPIVSKLLESEQTADDLKVQFETLRYEWGPQGQEFVQKVSDAIVDTARSGKLAINEQQAAEMFGVASQEYQHEGINRDNWASIITSREYADAFKTFYGDDIEDFKVVKAIYQLDGFKDYMQERKGLVAAKYERSFHRQPSEEELWRLTSEDVEREIVLRFSKLYLRVDEQRPNESFEQLAGQGGIYDSSQIVQVQMTRALSELRRKIHRMSEEERAEFFGTTKFYRRYSREYLGEKDIKMPEIKDKKTGAIIQEAGMKTVREYRIQPTAGVKQVGVTDFLEDVMNMVDHEVQTRSYLHNVRLAFNNPAGEGGFWGGLARYAEQIPSTDIDSMMYLPDSHLFMTAYRLYTKYLEEEFALVDWRHQPTMFSEDKFNNRAKIEQRVRSALRQLFPYDLEDKNEWRLNRAMSMAVGLAKGVLLTEVELAAWAEPHQQKENGKATFTSIYTNDATATATLNPQHHFLRWQTEGAKKGPLIFLPLIGMGGKIDKSFMRGHWDHRALWQSAQKFRESYLNGKASFHDRPDGEMLFIDFMPNFAKVGGYFTRGGWRASAEIEGWLIKEGKTQAIDMMRSWKALENIGYEALIPFVGMNDFNLTPELRDYIFAKYISPDNRLGISSESFFNKLKGSEKDKTAWFVNHAFANLLAQRIPTKLIKVERDRQSMGGVRAWELVKRRLDWNADVMNDRMQNLMMVESIVREETSRKMNEALVLQGDVHDLSLVEIDDYFVDEAKIRRVLGAAGSNEEQIQQTVELFKKIQEFIYEGQLGERYVDVFADKLKNKKFPFAIGVEEVDPTFLSLRGAGKRVLPRALGDTGQVETKVYAKIVEYINELQPLSLDSKHDIHKIVHTLHEMHHVIEGIHGHEKAGQLVASMASLTIAYFKKDSMAKNWLTKVGSIGRPNSLAAEFAGTFRGVWEWEVGEIDSFITELERMKLLPKDDFDLGIEDDVEIVDKKFLGLVPYKKTVRQNRHGYLTGKDLRESFGATHGDISTEFIAKFIPMALGFMMWTAISKALKEESGKK